MNLSIARFTGAIALITLLLATPARANAPAGRYTASGGVVHDNKTGLNWQQAVPTTTYTYLDAMTYCSTNMAALAGTGWRLPAIKELQTLVDDSVAFPGPAIDTSATGFPSTPASIFWSSTVDAPMPSRAWLVDFSAGGTFASGMLGANPFVRCVR